MTTASARAVHAVRSRRIEGDRDLLALLPPDAALAWVQAGEGLIGWGCAARLEVTGPDRFATAEAWWRELLLTTTVDDEIGLHGSGAVAFGSFSFADSGSSVLIVPEVLVGHRQGTWWLTTVSAASTATTAATATASTESPTATPALPTRTPAQPPGAVRFAEGATASALWMAGVAEAVRRVEAGELAKVVLARDVEAVTDHPLDVRWPLQRLAVDYPECWTFSVDGLIGATPEMLVRLEGRTVTSRVLAGTLRRSGEAAQDERRGQSFPSSIKDVEEHGYGVASVVEALSRHCDRLEVPPAPFVLELANVMHLATDVSGEISDGATSLGLLASLHPSAAVCGTPTAAALQVIRDLEPLDRARYAGPVGWMNATGDGEWGIALRCAEVHPEDPRRLRLFAGCGIVAGSKPAAELAESVAKLLPMRTALGS